ncbi:hypothetical protein BJX99DRAFT_254799 [Aspergillus californicus]
MGNGASSSNNGAHGNGNGETAGESHGHNQSDVLEASLIMSSPVGDDLSTNLAIDGGGTVGDAGESDETEDVITQADSNTNFSPSSGNLLNFSIIDSTLREGEQFALAHFDTAQKIQIARALDDFGVEYIELTSPAASEQSKADCEAICKLGLKAKVLCHIRCNMNDAKLAVQTGVDGINMCIGTSTHLMNHSHGKNMSYITTAASEVIAYVKSQNIEVRFSGEDSFRSDFTEILTLYKLIDKLGANRVGVADTVGGATPLEVYTKIHTLREAVGCDIETHFHNDTGCAVANAFVALEAGATHVDTTVLGIGERNGITSLGGLVGGLVAMGYGEYVLRKYRVERLGELERLVGGIVNVDVPFNNFVVPV